MPPVIQQKNVLAAAIFDDGRLLLVRRASGDSFLAGYWEIPGGGREPLEAWDDCLRREIREETSLEIEIVRPFSVWTYPNPKEDQGKVLDVLEVDFIATPVAGSVVQLSEEHEEYVWASEKELNQYLMTDEMRAVVKSAFKNVRLCKS